MKISLLFSVSLCGCIAFDEHMNCSADTHAAAAGGEGAADSGGDCGDDGDGGGGAAPTGDDANNGQSKYVCPHVCVCVFCWGSWGYTLVFFFVFQIITLLSRCTFAQLSD